tara:strand:- start:10049 stop:10540 length:492 start_codon:yes stop_codon:yes gene_type:complete
MSDFTIVEDTRERKPWSFSFFGADQVRRKVDTGDYTIEGYEGDITIDRKRNVDELYMNLFKEYSRFKREMERMEGMEAYILCEFPYSHILTFPDTMPLVWCTTAKKKVPMKLRFTSEHIIDRVETITKRHGVIFLYNDTRREAESQAFKILKEFYEKNQSGGA